MNADAVAATASVMIAIWRQQYRTFYSKNYPELITTYPNVSTGTGIKHA